MEMNKQRKILLGVLCTGVLGLVVDRVFMAAPESAAADDSAVIATAAPAKIAPSTGNQPTPPDANDTNASALPSYATLTERLIQAQQQSSETESQGRDDPFALPKQWQIERATPQPQEPEPENTASGQRLTAVF